LFLQQIETKEIAKSFTSPATKPEERFLHFMRFFCGAKIRFFCIYTDH
jgi:hypothetical protein